MIGISEKLAMQIRAEGEKAYPNECCGCLLGEFGQGGSAVSALLPIENALETEKQYNRFTITPEDFLRAEKEAQKIGSDLIGFYHSHPDHPAKPSDYDRENALPVYSYIIVSVEKGKAGDMSSWLLSFDRSRFDEEEIVAKEG